LNQAAIAPDIAEILDRTGTSETALGRGWASRRQHKTEDDKQTKRGTVMKRRQIALALAIAAAAILLINSGGSFAQTSLPGTTGDQGQAGSEPGQGNVHHGHHHHHQQDQQQSQ
jgi:hypothetical protein